MLWSVTENDDSPMQEEKIDDPEATHLTLTGLDRLSHYRFYLKGRTAAGYGESSMMTGATTLEGGIISLNFKNGFCWQFVLVYIIFKYISIVCLYAAAPPDDISVSVGENLVNVSWEAKKRQRNVGFYIHFLKKNGMIYALK